ncbi:MAG TPA: hypothetical protein VG056_01810 [Pirellulales bacterium]|jgi:hypothetical protein|nr:hypothetical protein [Pirellulales bacterium]
MDENKLFSRRRFQFSVRTLLIGVTMFCVVVGGFVGRQASIVRERRAWMKRITDRGGVIDTDWPNATPLIPWYRRLLGDQTVFWIMPYRQLGDYPNNNEIDEIQEIFPEAGIKRGL